MQDFGSIISAIGSSEGVFFALFIILGRLFYNEIDKTRQLSIEREVKLEEALGRSGEQLTESIKALNKIDIINDKIDLLIEKQEGK